MHGLGNDFVIVAEDELPSEVDVSVFVKLVTDRRQGVGCDPFITYKYDGKTNIQMGIYNQDGSRALACGNASRCLSHLTYDLTAAQKITLHIFSRKVQCEYISEDAIKVDMGPVEFDKSWMPDSAELWSLAEHHLIKPKEMLCVDVANPHLVIFSKLSYHAQQIIGQNFQNIDLFKDGINVSFASIMDDKIHLKVWERGVGFTYACGSGVVATFAAANKLGFAGDRAEIIFALGLLKMQKNDHHISINRPAK